MKGPGEDGREAVEGCKEGSAKCYKGGPVTKGAQEVRFEQKGTNRYEQIPKPPFAVDTSCNDGKSGDQGYGTWDGACGEGADRIAVAVADCTGRSATACKSRAAKKVQMQFPEAYMHPWPSTAAGHQHAIKLLYAEQVRAKVLNV